MLRGSKRIVITTEALNRFKFWVLTSGINLSQYEKNPLLIFKHERTTRDSLPIGQMVDLQIEEDNSITGVPLFDPDDEFAVKLHGKYEKGIIKMASAGLIPVEWSDAPQFLKEGQELPTLVKSVLDEVSLVDRGANDEALTLTDANGKKIELSANGGNPLIPKLKTKIENTMKIIELKNPDSLLSVLCLSADADETAIVAAVKKIADSNVQLSAKVSTLTDDLAAKTKELERVELAAKNAKIETLVQSAVDARKITADEKAGYVALAAKDYESVESILSKKQGQPTAQQAFNQAATIGGTNTNLSWDDLDKSGKLVELKASNPDQFKALFKQKYGKDYNG
ncbi:MULTISPECIES: hypothetical protein [Olivibacter]|uniref:Prohead serine protease n=1 Tax=Olivibacter jilunii TaxID=985016 RepID=A0ABW6AW02_9SPHI